MKGSKKVIIRLVLLIALQLSCTQTEKTPEGCSWTPCQYRRKGSAFMGSDCETGLTSIKQKGYGCPSRYKKHLCCHANYTESSELPAPIQDRREPFPLPVTPIPPVEAECSSLREQCLAICRHQFYRHYQRRHFHHYHHHRDGSEIKW